MQVVRERWPLVVIFGRVEFQYTAKSNTSGHCPYNVYQERGSLYLISQRTNLGQRAEDFLALAQYTVDQYWPLLDDTQ